MSIIEKALEKLAAKESTNEQQGAGQRADELRGPLADDASDQPPASAVERARPAEPFPNDQIADSELFETPDPAAATRDHQPAVLNIQDLKLEGILSSNSERSRSAEEYRMIKRPLLTRAFSEQPADGNEAHRNLIMVTSSVEGEGKTFTSLNLAISIAMEMDRTVLLVDADLAKPGLSRLLDLANRPGLTDRLINESFDLGDMLLPTDIPKFTVLPAGRRHRRSTELLASNNMLRLLDELALRYSDRVVLFDSPPLLATSEASVLAQQMGQICLVVESAVTPQYLVKDALARLDRLDNVSLVLNKCKPDLFLGRYGYGYPGYNYGYGYGYGYGKEQQ